MDLNNRLAFGPWTIVPNPPNPFPISTVGPAKFYRDPKPE